MKKRLVSLFLSLAVCLGIMPMAAFAEGDTSGQSDDAPVVATQVPEATLKEPKIGGDILFANLTVPEDSPYNIRISEMYMESRNSDGTVELLSRNSYGSPYQYECGVYEIHLKITPKEGYTLTEEMPAPVLHVENGEDWTFCLQYVHTLSQSAEAVGIIYVGDVPKRIMLPDKVLKATIKAPKAGDVPGYTIQVPEDAMYTAKISKWIKSSSLYPMGPEDTFQSGYDYKVEVVFSPKEGYYFESDAKVELSNETGPVETLLNNYHRNGYTALGIFPVDNTPIKNLDITFQRPRVGDKKADMPSVSIPDAQKDMYDISARYLYMDSEGFDTFGSGRYVLDIVATPKGPYVWKGDRSVNLYDQYGEKYAIGSEGKEVSGKDPLRVWAGLMAVKDNVAVFRVENGTWKDGHCDSRTVDTVDVDGNKTFREDQIPTGMIPNEGYGNGKWDVDPYTHRSNLTEDTYFTYTFKELKDSATVTLKIVNGQWSSEEAPTPTDEDIVIEVPLVDGKGSLPLGKIPNQIIAGKGCIPNGTWDVDFDTLQDNVTEDITCTYTCPRVVTEPLTYTVSFDGNGATSGEVPEPVSAVSDEAFCPVEIPATTTLEREGYKFIGWNTLAGGSGKWPVDNKITVRYDEPNLTLYAQWEKLESRKVEFVAPEAYSNTIPEPMIVSANADGNFTFKVPYIPAPYRPGYEFAGYKLTPAVPGADPEKLYQRLDSVVLGDAEVYQMTAQWKEKIITLTYDANGGTGAPPAESKPLGEASTVSFTISDVVPTREGYDFAGWSLWQGEEAEVIKTEVINTVTDTTLYAIWEKADDPDPDKPDPENPDKPDPENPDKPDPENPDKPDPENPDKPDPENPGKPDPKPDSKPDSKPDTKPETKPDAPDTGDAGMLLPAVLMMAASGTAAVLLSRRRRHR